MVAKLFNGHQQMIQQKPPFIRRDPGASESQSTVPSSPPSDQVTECSQKSIINGHQQMIQQKPLKIETDQADQSGMGPNDPKVYRLDARSKLIDPAVPGQRIVRPPHARRSLPPTPAQAPEGLRSKSNAMPERSVSDAAAPPAFEWHWGVR
jgi:hypothetical protein